MAASNAKAIETVNGQYSDMLLTETIDGGGGWDSGLTIIGGAYLAPIMIPSLDIPLYKELGPTSKVIILPGDENPRARGQCVNYVRYVAGVDFSGDAKYWRIYINATTPSVGDIVVMNAGYWGHIGIVVKVDSENGTITVRSRNYRGLWIISDDVFNINDPIIWGYIRK